MRPFSRVCSFFSRIAMRLNRPLAGRWFAALNPLSARGSPTVAFNVGIRVCDVDSKEFYTKLFLVVAVFVLVGVVLVLLRLA